jgi:cytochrome c peroxidase
MTLQRTFQIVIIGLALVSCDPIATPSASRVVDEYLDLPTPPYNYRSTEFSDLQVQLGRVLFYDPNLSANSSISCASCHKQEYAFGDNVAFSKGFDGRPTLRNTLPLVDARQIAGGKIPPSPNTNTVRHPPGGLFWDGRKVNMREAVMEPIFNDVEMGMDWPSLQKKLIDLPYYQPLFTSAFGRPEITYASVQQALAAFVGVMHSDASRVERRELSSLEKRGAELFATKYQCVNCHQGKMDVQGNFDYPGSTSLTSPGVAEFANIGLEASYSDPGLSLITKMAEDEGIFRVPSLNNVARTAPYMHDGSLASLGEVIDHYGSGLASHRNLDRRLRDSNNAPLRLTITEEEKDALVAFLNAFTDEDITDNVRLANPFKSHTKNRGRD